MMLKLVGESGYIYSLSPILGLNNTKLLSRAVIRHFIQISVFVCRFACMVEKSIIRNYGENI